MRIILFFFMLMNYDFMHTCAHRQTRPARFPVLPPLDITSQDAFVDLFEARSDYRIDTAFHTKYFHELFYANMQEPKPLYSSVEEEFQKKVTHRKFIHNPARYPEWYIHEPSTFYNLHPRKYDPRIRAECIIRAQTFTNNYTNVTNAEIISFDIGPLVSQLRATSYLELMLGFYSTCHKIFAEPEKRYQHIFFALGFNVTQKEKVLVKENVISISYAFFKEIFITNPVKSEENPIELYD